MSLSNSCLETFLLLLFFWGGLFFFFLSLSFHAVVSDVRRTNGSAHYTASSIDANYGSPLRHVFPWEKRGKSNTPKKSPDGCGCGCSERYMECSENTHAGPSVAAASWLHPDEWNHPLFRLSAPGWVELSLLSAVCTRMSGITPSFGLVSKTAVAAAGPHLLPEEWGSSFMEV